ncbi:MAG: hypothetical protein MHMPM18_002487 [Marteilia pararefringens]
MVNYLQEREQKKNNNRCHEQIWDKNCSFFMRNLFGFALVIAMIITGLHSLDTNQIYSDKFEYNFESYRSSYIESIHSNNKSSDFENTKQYDEQSKKIEDSDDPKIQKVVLFILDGFSFESLIVNQNYSDNIRIFLDILKKKDDRSRLFRIYSDGLLLTSASIRRMLYGIKCSLVECYDNLKGIMSYEQYSLLHELTMARKSISVIGPEGWQKLLAKNRYNIEFTAEIESQNIIDSIIRKDFTIVHPISHDRSIHVYGQYSEYTTHKLDMSIAKATQILEFIKGYNKKTLFILTGDHGATEFNHGNDTYLEAFVPFAAFVNFDEFFTRVHWPTINRDSKDDGDIIYQADQLDIPSTLASLMGVNINKSNEGHLIPEFFREYTTGNLQDQYFEANSSQLKEVIERRLYHINDVSNL